MGISPLALFRSSDVKISIGDRDEREDLEDSKEDIMSNMTNIGDSDRRASWYSPNRPPSGVEENDVVTTQKQFRPDTVRKTKVKYLWGDRGSDHGKIVIDWSLRAHASLTWKSRLLWESPWYYGPCNVQCSKWELYDYTAYISEDYQDLEATFSAESRSSRSFSLGKKKIFSSVSMVGASVNFYLVSFDIGLIGSLYVGGDVSFTSQFDLTYKRTFRRSGMAMSKRMNYNAQHQIGKWYPPTDQLDWGGKVAGKVQLYLEARISASLMSGFFWDKVKVGLDAYLAFRLYME